MLSFAPLSLILNATKTENPIARGTVRRAALQKETADGHIKAKVWASEDLQAQKADQRSGKDHAAELVTIEELSRYLHVPERILYRRIRTGQLPGRKVGGRWRLELLRVQDWLVDTYELKTNAEKKRSK